MITNYKKILIFCSICIEFIGLNAQPNNYDLQTISNKYKGQDAVMVTSKDNLFVDFDENGKIQIKNKHLHEIYYLTSNTKMYDDDYISYSSFNKVSDIKAILYDYNGKSFKKRVIENIVKADDFSNNVFYEESKNERVVFPQLTQGSLTSISYLENFEDAHLMQNIYFLSSYIPVDKAEVSIVFPENITIKYKIFNDNGKINFKEEHLGKMIKYSWTSENIEKYNRREEDFSITYYEPHIGIYISDYTYKNKKTEVLKDVDALYKWKYENLKTINKDTVPALKKLVDSLCVGKKTQLEKAKAIFYWVQSNIKYVAFEGGYAGFIPREAKDIFNNRYGDCKDMSSIQTKMYDYAGIESHLVSIGTRDIPYSFYELPTENVDNHMIAVVFIDGKHYFADGTAYFIALDFPSDAIQGKEALIFKGENYSIEKVPEIAKEKSQYIDTIHLSFNADTLKGVSTELHTGYLNFNLNILLLRTPKNKWKETLSEQLNRGSNKYKMESITVDSIDRDLPLKLHTTFSIPNYVKKAGNSYYVNLNLDRSFQNEKIDTSKQKFDKKINFKHILTYTTSLDVPVGFNVSKIPAFSNFENPEFRLNAKYNYDEKTRKIIYNFTMFIDALAIKPTRFNDWNAMIKKLGEVYSQVVVLEKL